MTTKPPMRSEELRARLRRGDPAEGESIPPADVARVRVRLSRALEESEPRASAWRRVGWGIAVGGAVLVAGVWLRPNPPRPERSMPNAPLRQESTRQVHFVTEGGTRIVWVLRSDLDL